MTPTNDIEVIEFHDAVVERIELTRSGNVRVELSHLPAIGERRSTRSASGPIEPSSDSWG